MFNGRSRTAVPAAALFCLALFFLPAALGTPAAHAQAPGEKSWEFERFDSDIQVHEDGSFTVRETQVVNFTGQFSYLTRDLSSEPASDVTEGKSYGKVRIKDIEVRNLDGTPYDRDLWKVESNQSGKTVRIEFSARDEQRGWIISYRMLGAIIYAADYDRLYWNAVPSKRSVPIKHSRVTVTLPPGADMDEVRYADYYEPPPLGGSKDSGRKGDAIWWEAEGIQRYRDFTIDVAFPKGLVQKPLPYRPSTFRTVLVIALALPVASLLIMLVLWWWKGREPDVGPVQQVSYDPPRELTPAIMGFLVYQHPRIDDVYATIVDLAVRGKYRIIEEADELLPGEKEFVIERKDRNTDDLLPHELAVMSGIFDKSEKDRVTREDMDLGNRLFTFMTDVQKEAMKRKLFYGDPHKVKRRYSRWGRLLMLLPPVLFLLLCIWFDLGWFWLLLAGTVAAGLVMVVVSSAMPRRTPLGARLYWQAMGFLEYLKTAEAGEAESMTLEYFSANLPYAMVLGEAGKWARLFQGFLTTSPDWYEGAGGGFDAVSFASSVESLGWSVVSSGYAAPSSSSSGPSFDSSGDGHFGGGSSGGGFGGGGSSAG